MGMLVSDNFFNVLGVQPALGRTFTLEEGHVPGRDAVVVLSYDFWKNALAEDTSILDAVVWMNGIDFHVIGVAPATKGRSREAHRHRIRSCARPAGNS
jgi:hypothetical protein